MVVWLSVRRSFVPEVKPVTVLLFLLFDTRRCMWCYLCRSVQTDNRDVSHHAPRASYRTHHYHSTLQQNHEVRHTLIHILKKKSQSVAILFLKSNWTLCEVAKAIAPISMMNKQIGLLWVNPIAPRSDQHETSPYHILIIQQTGNENI